VEALIVAGLALTQQAALSAPALGASSKEKLLEEGLAALRKAVALRPCDDGPHVALALALTRVGLRGEAAAVIRAAQGAFALDAPACPLPDWMPEGRRRWVGVLMCLGVGGGGVFMCVLGALVVAWLWWGAFECLLPLLLLTKSIASSHPLWGMQAAAGRGADAARARVAADRGHGGGATGSRRRFKPG
jgi:hypothetical protein